MHHNYSCQAYKKALYIQQQFITTFSLHRFLLLPNTTLQCQIGIWLPFMLATLNRQLSISIMFHLRQL